MVLVKLSPLWFYGYGVGLELGFAFISLIVALFAFRVYRRTSQRYVKLFGISFLLISISYFVQSIFNFLIIKKLNEPISRMMKLYSVVTFDNLGMITHIIFMTLGLAILAYITFKEKKYRLLWLLIVSPLLAIFFSRNMLYIFYLFASIYLIFIEWHFITNYIKNKKTTTLLIAIAFLLLLFGNFHFLFGVNHQLFYVLGHIFELVAYLLILTNFYLVLKK